MYVISVSKTHKHRGKNIKHRSKTKKVWQVMYYLYDEFEDTLTLHSKYVSRFVAWYYKLCKVHQSTFECEWCEQEFPVFYKWKFQIPKECEDCKL